MSTADAVWFGIYFGVIFLIWAATVLGFSVLLWRRDKRRRRRW